MPPFNFRNKTALTPLDVLTGSMSTPGPMGDRSLARKNQYWQRRILEYASAVPEPAGAGALVENSLRRVALRVEGMSPDENAQMEEWLKDFPLGRSGMLIWYVGEVFPTYKIISDNEIEWQANSPLEFRAPKGVDKSATVLGENNKWDPVQGKWFRTWKPDPAFKYKAWSVHKSMVDLLYAMYLHQHADTAVATSRLAGAGILWWPSSLPRLPLRDGKPEPGSQEELQYMLQHAMQNSIADRDGPDAIVPIVVFSDPTLGEHTRPEHVLMERPDDAQAFAARMQSYRERYATGVELPVESVTGMGPANHWTAWVVKEDKWRFYLQPLAALLAKSIERNFAIPQAKANNMSGVPVIVPDGSDIIAKPDRTDPAIRLFQLGGISNDAALEAAGFSPDDAPGEEEKAQMEAMRKASPRVSDLPANFRDSSPT